MNFDIDEVINRINDIKDLLSKFDSRDKAIEYLVKETNLTKEECSIAYDFYIGHNSDKKLNGA